MFVKPSRRATQGALVAASIGALALVGCANNEARTDLRPEGPPDVLAVLVLNDSVSGLVEAATYCKAGDEKRPSLVGLPDFTTTTLCPENLSETVPMAEDASPDTFYVRIMFDELLDPTIEDLEEILDDNGLPTGSFTGSIADTKPVTLRCTGLNGQLVDLDYDGYYSPSGNAVTWPVGPSLVVKPIGNVIVPTNSACEITLKEGITDKSGNAVPADQRGPFKFKISGIKPLLVDPSHESTVDAIQIYFDNFYAQFNTEVTIESLCPDDGNGLCGPGTAFDITPHLGGICAATGAPCAEDANCVAPDTCSMFYAYSLAPFGFTPAEFGFGPINPAETEKDYTFSFKAGAMLEDQCGAKTTMRTPSADDQTLTTVTTRPFGLRNTTPTVPNDGDTVSGMRKVNVAFNNVIDFASLDLTEWSITPQVFIPPTATVCVTNADCAGFRGGGGECRDFPAPTLKRCVNNYTTTGGNDGDIIFRGVFAMATDYTFTLKAGATVEDAYGKVYTQAMDKVIKFKTQPAVAVTASTPANGATVTKSTPTSLTSVTFSFNQAMVPSTLTLNDDFTISPAITPNATVVSGTSCSASGTACQLIIQGLYTPGDYTFTLKAGAKLTDLLGNEYTQAADRVIKFTVKEAPPATPVPCLGA